MITEKLSTACSLRFIDISVGLKSDLHDIKDWLRAIKSELK